MGENPNDQKEDRIKKFQIVAFLLLVVLPLVIVASFIGVLVFALKINLLSPIDSSTINGLLTAIAIVFGFASYEAREIKESSICSLVLW